MAGQQRRGRGRGRGRRWLRALGWSVTALLSLVLALLLGLGSLIVVLRLPEGRAFLRRTVLEQTADLLPGLRFARIAGDYTSELAIEQLVLADRFGGEAIRVARLSLRYDLWALTSRTVKIEGIAIEGPQVTVQPSRSGKLNLAELVVPSPPEPEEPDSGEPSAWTIALDRLRIERGTVLLRIDPKAPQRIEGIDLDLGATAGGSKLVAQLRRLAAGGRLPDGRRVFVELEAVAELDPRAVKARLELRARGLTPDQPLTLTLAVQGPPSRLSIESEIRLPGDGVVELDGWAGLVEGRPRFDLRLALARVDPHPLLPTLPSTSINLALRASGEGIPATPDGRLQVTLDVARSRVEQLTIDALKLRAGLRGKRWQVDELVARAIGARLELDAEGTFDRLARSRVALRAPRLARAARYLPGHRLAGALRLDLEAHGPFDDLAARLRLGGRDLTFDAQRVDALDLDADVAGLPSSPRGNLRLRGQGILPGNRDLRLASLTLAARGSPSAAKLELRASGPKIAADLKLAARRSGSRVDLDLQQLALAGLGHRLALEQPTEVALAADSRIELSPTTLRLLGGRVTLSGSFRPQRFPRLSARLVLHDVRPPGFVPLSAEIEATAGRRALEARVRARIDRDQGELELDARLPLAYRAGDPLPRPRRRGPAQVRLRLRRLALKLANRVDKTLPPLSGRLDLSTDLAGSLADPRLKVTVDAGGVRYGELGDLSTTVRLEAAEQRATLALDLGLDGHSILDLDGSLGLDLRRLAAGRIPDLAAMADAPLQLVLRVPSTALDRLAKLQPLPAGLKGRLALDLSLQGELLRPRGSLRLSLANARAAERDLGDLETTLAFVVAQARSTARLALTRNQQRLLEAEAELGSDLRAVLDGRRLDRTPLRADLRLLRLRLAQLATLDPQLEKIAGTLEATVAVRGRPAAPQVQSRITLTGARFEQTPVGDLTVDARYDDKGARGRLALLQPKAGGRLDAEYDLTLTGKRTIDARIVGRDLDLAFIHRLTPALRASAGKLSLELRARGPLQRPRLSGQLALRRGLLRPQGFSALEQIELQLALSPRRLELTRLALRLGEGTLDARGAVDLTPELQPGRFRLGARANKIVIDAAAAKRLRFSGRIRVEGQRSEQRLAANVQVIEGELQVPQIEAQRELQSVAPLSDVVFVDEAARAAKQGAERLQSRALALDLRARADPFFVRGEEVDLELRTSIRATTDDQGRVRLYGDVTIRRGRLKLLGNPFEVREATVRFSGQPEPDPAVNVLLAREIGGATILVGIRGTLGAPEIELRSEPPEAFDRSQIVSLLLTGRADPRGDADEGGDSSDQLVSAASAALAQALFGGVLKAVAPKVGIDVARVNLGQTEDESGEKRLRAEAELGKYLTRRLYVAYRGVAGADPEENANEALLEFRISARWLLTAVFGDAAVGGLDLLWTYRY